MSSPTERIDALVGAAVERAVMAKHRFRLARLGWAHALAAGQDGDGEPPPSDPPPRPGCKMQVLIDGAEALPAIAEEIAGAQRYVHITGWHLAPHFELDRGERPAVLGRLLADAADRVDVRVLVWAGAPVPLFHPTRKEVAEDVANLVRDTGIRCEPDPREHPFHCHHEKTVIVDGRVAFVGGIDMTDAAGDRFDVPGHPARRRLGWHDVGTRLEGPIVADVAEHFALRWHELTGEQVEVPEPGPAAGPHTVRLRRTVAEGMYDAFPRGDFGILAAYLHGLRSAQRLVYLENQFLWAPEIVAVLADKLRRAPHPDFRLVVVLPARANNGQDTTRGQLGVLAAADAEGGGGRFLACTLRSLAETRADPLYVHAKVGIVDDRWLTIGSANLNAHSLFNDTECNVVTEDPELVRDTRIRLWAEHLELTEGELADEPATTTVDRRWRPIASEQLRRLHADERPTHHLLEMPAVSRRSRRLLGPLEGLLDDG